MCALAACMALGEEHASGKRVGSVWTAATVCYLMTILRSVSASNPGPTRFRMSPPGSRVRRYVRQEAEGTVQRLRQAQRRDAGLPFVDIIADTVGTQEPLVPDGAHAAPAPFVSPTSLEIHLVLACNLSDSHVELLLCRGRACCQSCQRLGSCRRVCVSGTALRAACSRTVCAMVTYVRSPVWWCAQCSCPHSCAPALAFPSAREQLCIWQQSA